MPGYSDKVLREILDLDEDAGAEVVKELRTILDRYLQTITILAPPGKRTLSLPGNKAIVQKGVDECMRLVISKNLDADDHTELVRLLLKLASKLWSKMNSSQTADEAESSEEQAARSRKGSVAVLLPVAVSESPSQSSQSPQSPQARNHNKPAAMKENKSPPQSPKASTYEKPVSRTVGRPRNSQQSKHKKDVLNTRFTRQRTVEGITDTAHQASSATKRFIGSTFNKKDVPGSRPKHKRKGLFIPEDGEKGDGQADTEGNHEHVDIEYNDGLQSVNESDGHAGTKDNDGQQNITANGGQAYTDQRLRKIREHSGCAETRDHIGPQNINTNDGQVHADEEQRDIKESGGYPDPESGHQQRNSEENAGQRDINKSGGHSDPENGHQQRNPEENAGQRDIKESGGSPDPENGQQWNSKENAGQRDINKSGGHPDPENGHQQRNPEEIAGQRNINVVGVYAGTEGFNKSLGMNELGKQISTQPTYSQTETRIMGRKIMQNIKKRRYQFGAGPASEIKAEDRPEIAQMGSGSKAISGTTDEEVAQARPALASRSVNQPIRSMKDLRSRQRARQFPSQ